MRFALWAVAPLVALSACGDAPEGVQELDELSQAQFLGGDEVSVHFDVPEGLPSGTAFVATEEVRIEDRASIDGSVASMDKVTMFNDAEVEVITAKGDVKVFHRSLVDEIVAGGAVSVEHTSTVGSTTSSYAFGDDESLDLEFHAPDSSNGSKYVHWGSNQSLSPGRYEQIMITSGGTIKLSTGVYFADSFNMYWGSTVEFDDTNGPVIIVVDDGFAASGTWTDLNPATDAELLFVYLGSNHSTVETAFDGFFIAPDAQLVFGGNNVTHRGTFYAKKIVVRPGVNIDHKHFDPLRYTTPTNDFGKIDINNIPAPDISKYVKNRDRLEELGKALFWDINVGVDGQACASCHYSGGADVRLKNQVSPGLNDQSGAPVGFETFATGSGGTNYTLANGDFPLRKLSDPTDRQSSVVHHAGNDVISSQGTFRADISLNGDGTEQCNSVPDPVFKSGTHNVRRVEPRNAPTVINSVFNYRNFWDGRANNVFNGMDPFGRRNPNNTILKVSGGSLVGDVVEIENASLASQAAGPPLSDFEMNCGQGNADFRRLGRRILPMYALALQDVSGTDSVLGSLADPAGGLTKTYSTMIQEAFENEYWDSAASAPGGFTLMENNFSLFFGLAVQEYEATLISTGDSPFDDFQNNNFNALTSQEKLGMKLFRDKGKCVSCHHGPELSGASDLFKEDEEGGLVERMQMNIGVALYDNAFYNIGVTPTVEDIGVGANDPWGNPLSFTRQEKDRVAGNGNPPDPFEVDPSTFEVNPGVPVSANERDAVYGAFKTSGLRNIELSGPYFHNGGQATLRQVVEFYNRGSDALSLNSTSGCDNSGFGSPPTDCSNLDSDITTLGLSSDEIDAIVAFMKALTDRDVRDEQAPFDHPSLPLAIGHEPISTDSQTCDDEAIELPAVGAAGRTAAGLPMVPTFDALLACVDGDATQNVSCFTSMYGATVY